MLVTYSILKLKNQEKKKSIFFKNTESFELLKKESWILFKNLINSNQNEDKFVFQWRKK